MGTETRRFGVVWALTQLVVWVFLAIVQVLTAVNSWRAGGGPDGWTLAWVSVAVVALLNALAASRSIVRVGDGRLTWWVGRRHHDLAFDEVADIRKRPRRDASEVVTTDGRVLLLPLRPHHGPEVWQLVFGDRDVSAV